MSQQSVGNRVQANLEQAVDSLRLPENIQERAEQLLARLKQPVRIGLMGLPESGKSTLLNLLVGQVVLPVDTRLPTLQLSYGDAPKSICTMQDGSKATFDHTDGRQIAELSPVFVEMQMPLPALGKISVLEVVSPADHESLKRASQWAAKRCDVVLWCTQGFNPGEQMMWALMPDIIKDHAFLMLTKADFLEANGMLEDTLATVRSVALDEFNQILPISTKKAIASRRPNGTVDKDLMRRSGGSALISAVLKQVERGRQSAVDMADVLLAQYADVLSPPKTAPEPVEEEAAEVETTESDEQDAAVMEAVINATVAETETPEAPAEATEDDEPQVVEAAQESNVVVLQPATRDAYEHVVAYIVEQGRTLIDLVADAGDAAPAKVIAKAVEHVQWLSDYLNEHGDDADPSLQTQRDAAMDAADLVQLMQMEKSDNAAVDAVSVLLQIKHELQADLAA